MRAPPSPRIVVVPWYSRALFNRLRRELVDGAALMRGSYEQWCERTASEIEALQNKGWVVIRVDADVEALDAYHATRFEEADIGSWREYITRR